MAESKMDPVTSSALIGAAGDILGSVTSGIFKPSLRKQWRYQKKQMALQQQYALEQMAKQAELNYGNWQKQFDYENSYNDPSKVFDRYLKAGVTPAGVLGSSGVGVNATMSGGSAGSVGASGPSGGSFDFSNPVPGLGGAVSSAADMMTARSVVDRNRAAAARDEAEADLTNAHNFGKERFLAAFDLANQLTSAGIKEKNAQAAYISALQTWQDARNQYADLIAANDWLKSVGECAKITEEYNYLRARNNAEIPLMDKAAAANVAYIQALTGNLRANSRYTDLQADDFEQWFDVNWNSEIEVDDVDADGKIQGKKKMTGRQIAEYLLGLDYTSGKQGRVGEGFMNWQRKHPLLTVS